MVKSCIGDKNKFAIEYDFIDEEQYTELAREHIIRSFYIRKTTFGNERIG